MVKEFDTAKLQSQLSGIALLEECKKDPLKYLELQDMLSGMKDMCNSITEHLRSPIRATRQSA